MISLSKLYNVGGGFSRIPRFIESQARLLHHAPESVLTAPIDGQIAIPTETQLPARAQVVIAGAGMIGNSVAFHLTQVRPAFYICQLACLVRSFALGSHELL